MDQTESVSGSAAQQTVAATGERSCEVRLGLVMYGGISLAIYIYGVATEFFNAVRGRGIYKLIKGLTDADIVVDVISGTSAGGINGILLAYCLANELEFGEAASIWRDKGGIRELLRDPLHDRSPRSVLRGDEYFLESLVEAFRSLAGVRVDRHDEDASALPELDLFVTGTDVYGRIERWFDAAGHPVDVKDHRALFHLKHRAGRKEPLRPRGGEEGDALFNALGKLARITSCFPGAFEAVQMSEHLGKKLTADGLLCDWGWGQAGTDRNVFFMDGGVLDNKPFTPTISEIFHRLSDRRVIRKLFYVEPDPERFNTVARVEDPGLVGMIWGGLSGIPGYESTIDDLRQLTEHNERVARFRRLVQATQAGAVTQPLDSTTAAMVQRFRDWEDGVAPAPQPAAPGSQSTETPCRYAQSRLVALSERAVEGVLRVDGRNRQLSQRERIVATRLMNAYDRWPGNGDFTLYGVDVDYRMRRLFHMLYACPDPPPGGGDEAERIRRVRYAFNRQVKLLEIVRSAMERALDEGDFVWMPDAADQAEWQRQADEDARWQDWAQKLWQEQIAAVFLFLLNVGVEAAPLLPAGYETDWANGAAGPRWLPQADLTAVHHRLQERVQVALEHLRSRTLGQICPDRAKFVSLLTRIDACDRRILAHVGPVAAQAPDGWPTSKTLDDEYRRFMAIDAQLFLLRTISGINEQDVIDTVRISPLDARKAFSCRPLEEKVSGDAVSHFGGFFKKSWRSNDILWGRLDAVCQLTETILDAGRIADVMRHPSLRRAVAQRVQAGGDLAPTKLFPGSPPVARATLSQWLSEVTSDDDGERAAALDGQRFADAVELLIEAQQLETLHVEVPNVIEDAISEQADWNQYRVRTAPAPATAVPTPANPAPAAAAATGFDPGAGVFERGEGFLDRFVATTAAQTLAQQAIASIRTNGGSTTQGDRPRDTPLGTFFRTRYRVGSESLEKDVPSIVLLKILSTVLLVTRNCIVTLWGDRADSIRRNSLYRILSGMLWAFDGLVTVIASGAAVEIGVLAVLTATSAVLFLVGLGWLNEIIWTKDGFQRGWAAVFLVVPGFVLLSIAWLLLKFAQRNRGDDSAWAVDPSWGRVSPRWIAVLAIVAVAAAIAAWYVGPGQFGVQLGLLQNPAGIAQLPADTAAQVRASVLIDYVFLSALGLGLFLAALHLAARLATTTSVLPLLGKPLAALALLGAAVDAVENTVLLWLLANPQASAAHGPLAALIAVGQFCSRTKFILPVLVAACCAVGWLRLKVAGYPAAAGEAANGAKTAAETAAASA